MVLEVYDEYETNLRLKIVDQRGEHLTARYIIAMDSYETILSPLHPSKDQCVIKLTGYSSLGKGLQLYAYNDSKGMYVHWLCSGTHAV